ncbi:sensor histidine kinase [Gemmatimonas sp.]|uniref:sensor histidine kinase n=1 Tax=Gemmatimonas sp. TaxID=1962908 RepID=UPI003F721FBF
MTQRTARVWLFWLTMYLVVTVFFYSVSQLPDIRVAHGMVGYLVLIIAASRHGGRALSLTLVVLSYLAVDWYFVPPRFTVLSATNLDWIVLLGFLVTGWMISERFATEQAARRIAEERTREVERLSRERLQLEREASTSRVLKEAYRLKNALLGSVAHDLRSPVATLSLLADPASGFEPDVALRRIGEEAMRLGEFIGTMQRFASEGGSALLMSRHHAPNDVIQTALKSWEAALTNRQVRVAAMDEALQVVCDLTLSVQVLGNLLQNAARYSAPTAPVDVFVHAADTTIDMIVADRGPGITGDVEKLFTPMRRYTRSSVESSSEASMGMGLNIARTFARAQRGDVLCRAREGGGSEFIFRLPRELPTVVQ